MRVAADPGGSERTGTEPARRRSGTTAIVAVGVGALVLRIAYVLAVTRHGDLGLEGDAFSYSAVAGNLRPGSWFIDPFTGRAIADHPPMTVLLLAPVSAIFDSILAERLTMAVVGSLAVVVIGLVGRRVAGAGAGVAAALVAAVNPNLWINDGLIMSESLSALVIALLLLAGFWLWRQPGLGRCVAVGLLCGVAVLTRGELALFVPFMVLPIILLVRDVPIARRLGWCVAACIATAAVVLPWSGWNSSRFSNPVVISTNDGTLLAGANCPATYGGDHIGGWLVDCVAVVDVSGLDASQASAAQRSAGLTYLRDHKSRVPIVVLAREARAVGLWEPGLTVTGTQNEGRRPGASWVAFGFFWVLVPFSIIGAMAVRRSGVTLAPFSACLLTSLVVVAAAHGSPRLRLPLDVAMSVLGGVAVAWWIERRRAESARTPELPSDHAAASTI